jgi:hypothetical protein
MVVIPSLPIHRLLQVGHLADGSSLDADRKDIYVATHNKSIVLLQCTRRKEFGRVSGCK